MPLEYTINRFADVPEDALQKFGREMIEKLFKSGKAIVAKELPKDGTTETRYYFDSGVRIKSTQSIIDYLNGDQRFIAKDSTERSVINKPTAELTRRFGKKTVNDYFSAGFTLGRVRSHSGKTVQFYLPNGRQAKNAADIAFYLDAEKKPEYTDEFGEKIRQLGLKKIPGIKEDELTISRCTDRKNDAMLTLKVNGCSCTRPVMEFVNYEGEINNELFSRLFAKCRPLHQRLQEEFTNRHDKEKLKAVAAKILKGTRAKYLNSAEGEYGIVASEIASVDVEYTFDPSRKTVQILTKIEFNAGQKTSISLNVPYDIGNDELIALYTADIEKNGANFWKSNSYLTVSVGSKVHKYVNEVTSKPLNVAETFKQGNNIIETTITISIPEFNRCEPFVAGKTVPDKKAMDGAFYCEVANFLTIKVSPEKNTIAACVYLTYSTFEDFVKKVSEKLLSLMEYDGGCKSTHLKLQLSYDAAERGKSAVRCEATLIDAETGIKISGMKRCLLPRLRVDIARSIKEIPTTYAKDLWNTCGNEIKAYGMVKDEKWLEKLYRDVHENYGILGYEVCKLICSDESYRRFTKTDIANALLENTHTPYNKNIARSRLEDFLHFNIQNNAGNDIFRLFDSKEAENYYCKYDLYYPVCLFALEAIVSKYEAEREELSLKDLKFLSQAGQEKVMIACSAKVETAEDAFDVIQALENLPKTMGARIVKHENFANVYLMLSEEDRIYADVVIGDIPGCVKKLKELQKNTEEK